jgi:hypothetical protein
LNSSPPLLSFPPFPLIPGIVSTDTIFAFTIHVFTFFLHWIHPPTSLLPLVPILTHQPGQNLFHLPVLQFCRREQRKDIKKNMSFGITNKCHREFPCDISTYICIITLISLPPLIFFILP